MKSQKFAVGGKFEDKYCNDKKYSKVGDHYNYTG